MFDEAATCEVAALKLETCDRDLRNNSHTCPDQFSLAVCRISHDVSCELVETCIHFTGNARSQSSLVVMPLDLQSSNDADFQSRSDNQLDLFVIVSGSKLVSCPCA